MLMLTTHETLPSKRPSFAKNGVSSAATCLASEKHGFLTDYSRFSFLANYKHLSKVSKTITVIII